MSESESAVRTSDSESSNSVKHPTAWGALTESIKVALKQRGVSEETVQAAYRDVAETLVNHDGDLGEKECISPSEGLRQTICQIENVPQEAVDFAFDQMEAHNLDQLVKYHRQPLGGEIEYDYENQRIIVTGRTVLEQTIIEKVDQKIADMMSEVEHGERQDFTAAELHEARKAICVNLNTEFSNA